MKQLISLLAAALYTTTSFAQSTSGIVNYEQTISFGDIKLENVPAEVAAMFPKEHKEQKVLYFTAERSLYENIPKKEGAEEPEELNGGNVTIRIKQDAPDEKVFTDLKNKKTVQQKALMDRTFLITDDIKGMKWKITGNQKKILDHAAMEATVITENDTITAWFTTDIPVSAGPESISGLPGLVLEAAIGKRLVLKAVSVQMDESAGSKIKEPTKGKKITSAEFAKIEKEKQEEMKREFGGNGNVIFRTITN